jgi:hypothetical protein
VLVAAEEPLSGRERLGFRHVHAALAARHHALSRRLSRPGTEGIASWTPFRPGERLQQRNGRQHYDDEDEQLSHASGKPGKEAMTATAAVPPTNGILRQRPRATV